MTDGIRGQMVTNRRIHFAGIAVCILFIAILLSCNAVYAADTPAVSITNQQPAVGKALEVSVEGISENAVCSYVWAIDDVESDCRDASYIPSAADYEKWIEVRVYNNETMIGSDRIWFSKLPVVYINTDDGEAITSRTEYKPGSMVIQGNEQYGQEYNGIIQVKSRGNQSWYYDKKPYKIKLDSSTNLFGFGKNKHWVLLANYRDESLLRNTIANDISTHMGLVSADTTWVDLVINGEYVGNYQLCEHIRIAEPRINIFNWDDEAENVAKAIYKANTDKLTKDDRDAIEDSMTEDYSWITSGTVVYEGTEYHIKDYYDYNQDISGGYLLEMNSYVDYLDGEREISEFDTKAGVRVIVDKPEYAVTNSEMMNYVKEYMQDYEDAFSSADGYNADNIHYTQIADFDSMVSYWLTQEICGNNDAYARSRWAYKDIGELLTFGPVWDFDYGFGTAAVGSDAVGWKFTHNDNANNFFKNWIDDPYFTIKAQEQYWRIRPYLQSIVDDGGVVDQYHEYLKESGAANEKIWKWSRGYQADTDSVKKYLKERLAWLDIQFASQKSIMESLYTTNSAKPYTKSDNKLAVLLDNAVRDDISAHVPADGLISEADTLACTVTVADANTKKLAVYVNGLKLDEERYIFDVSDGSCSFSIPAAAFTEEKGTKNIISLMGQNASGKVTCTNFVSVIADSSIVCRVTYLDYDGTLIKTELVKYGGDSALPQAPQRTGYTFVKWSGSTLEVMQDITVEAVYEKNEEPATGTPEEPKEPEDGSQQGSGETDADKDQDANKDQNADKDKDADIDKNKDTDQDKGAGVDDPKAGQDTDSSESSSIVLRWDAVKGASHYEIYAAVNGKKYGKAVAEVKADAGQELILKELNGKAIDESKIYKFKIKAYGITKGKKKCLKTTGSMYVVSSKHTKYTNAAKIKTSKSKYQLKAGKTASIKASVVRQDKNKKLLPKKYGARLTYTSSDKKVAAVTKSGKIKAKKKGSCYIYIRALNGLQKKVRVTVK